MRDKVVPATTSRFASFLNRKESVVAEPVTDQGSTVAEEEPVVDKDGGEEDRAMDVDPAEEPDVSGAATVPSVEVEQFTAEVEEIADKVLQLLPGLVAEVPSASEKTASPRKSVRPKRVLPAFLAKLSDSKKKKEKKQQGKGKGSGVVAPRGVPKKPHRYRPGTVAKREVLRYQKSFELLMQKAPFRRLVREIGQECIADLRWQEGALEALQHAAEGMQVELLEVANQWASHAGRVTVDDRDIRRAKTQLKIGGEQLKGMGLGSD